MGCARAGRAQQERSRHHECRYPFHDSCTARRPRRVPLGHEWPQEAAYTYETTATNSESTTVIAEMTIAAVAAVGDETLRHASIAIIIAAPANATLNMPRSTEMSATIGRSADGLRKHGRVSMCRSTHPWTGG